MSNVRNSWVAQNADLKGLEDYINHFHIDGLTRKKKPQWTPHAAAKDLLRRMKKSGG